MYFYSGGCQTIYLFGSILKVAKVLNSLWAVILVRLVHNLGWSASAGEKLSSDRSCAIVMTGVSALVFYQPQDAHRPVICSHTASWLAPTTLSTGRASYKPARSTNKSPWPLSFRVCSLCDDFERWDVKLKLDQFVYKGPPKVCRSHSWI